MQIKTTDICNTILHLEGIKKPKLKPLRVPNGGKGMEQLKHSNTGGTVKLYNYLKTV